MADLSGTYQQMFILFAVALVGFAAAKLDYLGLSTKDDLTKLLINITVPCTVLASVDGLDAQAVASRLPLTFLLAVLMSVLLLVVAALSNRVIRVPKSQTHEYLYMGLCPNVGFLGIPMIQAIYGSESVLYASIFMIAHSFFIYSVGAMILAPENEGEGGHRLQISWKSVVNPALVACVAAIVLFLAQIELPDLVVSVLDTVGGITTPMALMLVGVMMANIDLKSVVGEARLYPHILIRQLVAPLVLYAILSAVVEDALLVGVFTVMFALPIGMTVSLFVEQYGRDGMLAAKGTILSTAVSFALLPCLVSMMALF